jgi:hypothetical protein
MSWFVAIRRRGFTLMFGKSGASQWEIWASAALEWLGLRFSIRLGASNVGSSDSQGMTRGLKLSGSGDAGIDGRSPPDGERPSSSKKD